jgi:hypothetical protein
MQVALQPYRPIRSFDRRNANFLLALVFWVFTYALFTYRAYLRYGDEYELTSTIRLVSTLVGAGLYWLVLSKLIDGTRDRPGKPVAVIATILPASIVVLLARVILDYVGAFNPNGFAGDMRFVLVWSGYFGLWVSVSFVLRSNWHSEPVTCTAPIKVQATQVAAPRQIQKAPTRADVLDRLALEMVTMDDAERRALMESFTVPVRYEMSARISQAI